MRGRGRGGRLPPCPIVDASTDGLTRSGKKFTCLSSFEVLKDLQVGEDSDSVVETSDVKSHEISTSSCILEAKSGDILANIHATHAQNRDPISAHMQISALAENIVLLQNSALAVNRDSSSSIMDSDSDDSSYEDQLESKIIDFQPKISASPASLLLSAKSKPVPLAQSINIAFANINQPSNLDCKNDWALPSLVKVLPSDLDPRNVLGEPIQINCSSVKENYHRLKCALVGKLLGKNLPFHVLHNELSYKWNKFGEFTLYSVTADCFICIFKDVSTRDNVLSGGPWHILGQILALDEWTHLFNPHSMKGLTAPVWVRLPYLPLLYWDKSNIARIAQAIGTPLWIDDRFDKGGRRFYARVCVKINLSKSLPKGVLVDGVGVQFWQPFEYEGISSLCFHCGKLDHKVSSCPSKPHLAMANDATLGVPDSPIVNSTASLPYHQTLNTAPDNVISSQPPPTNLDENIYSSMARGNVISSQPPPTNLDENINSSMARGYGPWTLVKRKTTLRKSHNNHHKNVSVPKVLGDHSPNDFSLVDQPIICNSSHSTNISKSATSLVSPSARDNT